MTTADDARDRLCVLLFEVAAPKQQGRGHDDRPERVTQVVPEDADEHLPELRDPAKLVLARLGALLGGVRLDRQLLRPNRRADHLLVRLAQVDDHRIHADPFAAQVLVGGLAFGHQTVGLMTPPHHASDPHHLALLPFEHLALLRVAVVGHVPFDLQALVGLVAFGVWRAVGRRIGQTREHLARIADPGQVMDRRVVELDGDGLLCHLISTSVSSIERSNGRR